MARTAASVGAPFMPYGEIMEPISETGEELHAIYSAIACGVVVYDAGNVIIYANDIYPAAGPLNERESCVIRQHPLGWRPDPGVNIDRLLQTLQEYARETVSPHTSASGAKHSERCAITIASERNALSR